MYRNFYDCLGKRFFDITLILVTSPIILLMVMLITTLFIILNYTDIIYSSNRVGFKNKIFLMYKFRTMKRKTPQLATHLLKKSQTYITPVGFWLRKLSLDELPQIINVIKGDMSIVGPRPALYNQHNLIKMRKRYKIQYMRPGITGWAQVNGRDDLSISQKVKLDYYYKKNQSLSLDLKILIFTIVNVILSKGLKH